MRVILNTYSSVYCGNYYKECIYMPHLEKRGLTKLMSAVGVKS